MQSAFIEITNQLPLNVLFCKELLLNSFGTDGNHLIGEAHRGSGQKFQGAPKIIS